MTALMPAHAWPRQACSASLQLLYARRVQSLSRLYTHAADNPPTRPAP
ncbi:hypothetical protein ALP00_02285 [Pseudomonas coronafaciens pv. porri]|nr:hypothetical protein ALP00_02285 [Pseudomonas coronafaciens pv. porri]